MLDHFDDLKNEWKSLRELAEEAGIPERTVRDAWHRVRNRIAMAPKIVGHDPGRAAESA